MVSGALRRPSVYRVNPESKMEFPRIRWFTTTLILLTGAPLSRSEAQALPDIAAVDARYRQQADKNIELHRKGDAVIEFLAADLRSSEEPHQRQVDDPELVAQDRRLRASPLPRVLWFVSRVGANRRWLGAVLPDPSEQGAGTSLDFPPPCKVVGSAVTEPKGAKAMGGEVTLLSSALKRAIL